MPNVEFHFDFGSPNAYLAHRIIPGIEARSGVTFAYVPVLLGGVFKATGNRSPAEAFRGIRNKPEYQPAWDCGVSAQSVFSGEHVADHAWSGGGADRWWICRVC
jgi:hypothetical protein